jgi:hypothetical protein
MLDVHAEDCTLDLDDLARQLAKGVRLMAVACASNAGEQAAVVGIASRQIVDHGVDDPLRHLRTARAIEENGYAAVNLSPQCGELGPDKVDVEHGGASQGSYGATDRASRRPWPC